MYFESKKWSLLYSVYSKGSGGLGSFSSTVPSSAVTGEIDNGYILHGDWSIVQIEQAYTWWWLESWRKRQGLYFMVIGALYE